MADENVTPNQDVDPLKKLAPILKQEEKLSFLLEKIVGDDISVSETQINEMLAQRRQVNEYIHAERMQKHDRFKILSTERKMYFFGLIFFILVVGGAILILKPEYLGNFFTVILAIFGGIGIKDFFIPPKEQ